MLFSVLDSLLALEERAAMTWFSIYYSKFPEFKADLHFFFFVWNKTEQYVFLTVTYSSVTSLHSVFFVICDFLNWDWLFTSNKEEEEELTTSPETGILWQIVNKVELFCLEALLSYQELFCQCQLTAVISSRCGPDVNEYRKNHASYFMVKNIKTLV